MRKLFLLVVIVMAAISASAQEGIYLGGGISLWRNNDLDKTSFSITPDVGYNLSEKMGCRCGTGLCPQWL